MPLQHRDMIARMLTEDPRGVLVLLNVFLCVDLAAGHNYERQINRNFIEFSCQQCPRANVFELMEKKNRSAVRATGKFFFRELRR